MKFSVIIPTANRPDVLAKCLDNVYFGNQSIDKSTYEIIVTDDGQFKVARELIHKDYPLARWIEGPKRGPAANRNHGAAHATGEWLIFLDDDVVPDLSILMNYKKAIIENPSAKAFEGGIHPDDQAMLLQEFSECPINEKGGCFWSANICVNRETFNAIHGFDENFKIAAQEDQDIYIRLKKCATVKFEVEASVIHPVRMTTLSTKVKRIPTSLESWIYFSLKHGSFSKMVGEGFKSQLTALVQSARRGRVRTVCYHLLVVMQILPAVIYYYRSITQKLTK